MSTLHQVASEAGPFICIGPVTVHRQVAPKTSKNGRVYSTVILKSAGNELMLSLWDEAAKWKLPLKEVSLRGKFTKENWGDKQVLTCEELSETEGATRFEESEIQGEAGKVKVKDCLDAGLRGADYIIKKGRPELAEAAFTFVAEALSKGLKLE